MDKIIEHIKHQISCFKTEKSKVGASQIDKLSLGGRIAALEEILVFINENKAKNAATTIAEKIAEIERKQNFTSDWFEESLQEMADFVKAKYRSIENNNIALVKTCDMFRAENAKLKERINEMVESRREYLDV
jgi:hypothetical protein